MSEQLRAKIKRIPNDPWWEWTIYRGDEAVASGASATYKSAYSRATQRAEVIRANDKGDDDK